MFVKIFHSTVLNIVKEKIVRAQKNRVLHLGCIIINRVEGVHGKLKKYLMTSVGDLCTCIEKIHDMLLIQLTEIHT